MLVADALALIVSILKLTGEINNPWLTPHHLRYAETLKRLKAYDGERNAALELGVTKAFQYVLSETIGFKQVYGTKFREKPDQPASRSFSQTIDGKDVQSTFLTLNFEDEAIPLPDESLDLVLCCEVIEHMDVDPMFLMAELNRVLKPGGTLLLTTPNSASSQNVWKIINGYRPHFFMQYTKDRSPYRHNFEYDVHGIRTLTEAAGFSCVSMETVDTFGEPSKKALKFLAANSLPTQDRGDNIFYIGKKSGPVVERYPAELYV
jgi:SAM-dependent methyltransferase